jgi:PAS domain S-box-containing protein
MKYEEFDTELLKKYASFLYHNNLDDVINHFHLKNLRQLESYSRLGKTDITNLINSEIYKYLESIKEGNITNEINTWIANLKANKLSWISHANMEATFLKQILYNRKLCLIEFISKYTNDVNHSISIIKEIEYLSFLQENQATGYPKLQADQTDIQTKEIIKLKKRIFKMKKILEQTLGYINIYDLDKDRLIYNNDKNRIIFGYMAEEVMESKFSSFIDAIGYPEDKKKIKDSIRHFSNLKDNEIIELEYRVKDKAGNIQWIFSKASVFKRKDKRVTEVLLNGLNISELKKAEEERNYVIEQLKEAQKIAHVGSYDWDIVNDILIYTDEAYRIYDFPEEKKKFKYSDFKARLKAEDVNSFEEDLNKVFLNKSSFHYEGQFRIVLPDNTEKDIFSRAKINRDKEGNPVRLHGTVTDITSMKKAEHNLRVKNIEIKNINQKLEESQEEIRKINSELEQRIASRTKELQESEEQYRFLAENVPQLFWTTRPDGGLDFLNNNTYSYTGSNFELIGEWSWQNYIHPEDLPIMLKKWIECLNTGTTFETEFRIKRFDGVYRWHLVRTVPLKNNDGKVIKWMGSATDIDEQKKYAEELKTKNDQLIKTNNDLDNFIYTASHDLKTPISNIEGLLNALDDEMSKNQDVSVILSMMNTSVEKFKRTLSDLTEISKAQKSGDETIEENDISELLEEVKSMEEQLIKSTRAIIKTDFDNCTKINFSRKNLKSIIYNLLSNALKFRMANRRPEIFIKTGIEGNYIILSVKDNGQGFDLKQKAKIFKMFKRLQSDTEGTGIGLYLVKRIVTNAGGKIEVESEIGKGSVFKVYIPIMEL